MPNTPEDNALLAQFAGLAMQVLIQRDHGGNPITQDYVVRPAYDAAELMLQEHKRRIASLEPVTADPQAEPTILVSTAIKIIEASIEFLSDPEAPGDSERIIKAVTAAMRRASGDGQERGNG